MTDIRSIAATRGKHFPLKDYADNGDLRVAIVRAVPGAKAQTATIAKKFKGKTEAETAKNIFDFLLNNVRYVPDKENQLVKFPSALLAGQAADCKSFSLFTAGILENLGIGYKFVLASYDPAQPIPSHIYVETNSGIIIDAVWKKFNSEKKAAYKYKIPMKVGYMTGLGGDCCSSCQNGNNAGMGGWLGDKLDQFKNWVQEKATDVKEKVQDSALLDKFKGVSLSPGRFLFRAMVETNLDGIANKLAEIKPEIMAAYWKLVGGDPENIKLSISRGSKRSAKKFGFLPLLKNKVGISGGMGAIDNETLTAAIAVLAPSAGAAIGSIVPAVGTAAGTAGGVSFGAVLIAMLPLVSALLSKTQEAPPAGGGFNDPGDQPLPPDVKDEQSFWDQRSILGLKNSHVAVGLLAIGAAYYAKKKGLF